MKIVKIIKVFNNFVNNVKARNSRGSVMTKDNKLFSYGELIAYKTYYDNTFYIWVLSQLGFNNDIIRMISPYFKSYDITVLNKTAKGGYFLSQTTSLHINRFRRYLEDKQRIYYLQQVPTEHKILYESELCDNPNCIYCYRFRSPSSLLSL